jgi:hypothetical protein
LNQEGRKQVAGGGPHRVSARRDPSHKSGLVGQGRVEREDHSLKPASVVPDSTYGIIIIIIILKVRKKEEERRRTQADYHHIESCKHPHPFLSKMFPSNKIIK